MHEGDLLDVGLRGPCWKQHPCSFHTAILNGNFALCERCDLVVVGDYHNRHFLFVEFGKRLSTDSLLICPGSRWARHTGGCGGVPWGGGGGGVVRGGDGGRWGGRGGERGRARPAAVHRRRALRVVRPSDVLKLCVSEVLLPPQVGPMTMHRCRDFLAQHSQAQCGCVRDETSGKRNLCTVL